MAAVPTSQNRWPVHPNQLQLHVLPWITGRVVGGDVWTVFDYLCRRFDAEVERIDRSSSWGWAYRPIRGALTGLSNHASATAADLNADKHPLGVRGTFSAGQKAAVRRILADIGPGVLRWGEDYKTRVDGMHFELDVPPGDSRLVKAAARIRLGQVSGASPGLPSTGDGPTISKPTTPPTGGLSMSDIATIMAALNEIKEQNRSIHQDTSSGDALAEAARKVAAFPVSRGGVKVPWIQDTADTRTAVAAVAGEVAGLRSALAALLAGQQIDIAAIEAAAKRGTEQALESVTVDVKVGGRS